MDLARHHVEIDAVERGGRPKLFSNGLRACCGRTHGALGSVALCSACNTGNAHLFISELAPVDDDVVIERDGTVPHRHIVVSLGRALAAALGIGPGREQEIAGKAARTSMMSFGIGTVECDGVPASLRIEPPAEMGD